jgi:hypothetical protein
MSQTGAIEIIQPGSKNLRFSFEPAKRRTVNYPVAVPLELGTIWMRLFREYPAFAGFFVYRVRRNFSAHNL